MQFMEWLRDKIIKPTRFNRKEFFLGYKILSYNFK